MRARGIIGLVLGGVLLLPACTSSDQSQPAGTAVTQGSCSTGAPRTWESIVAQFAIEDVPASGRPLCVPRCGGSIIQGDVFLGVESVPSGACEASEPECAFALQVQCCGTGTGPRSGVVCRCAAGTWSCSWIKSSLGAGTCGACNADGGAPEAGGPP